MIYSSVLLLFMFFGVKLMLCFLRTLKVLLFNVFCQFCVCCIVVVGQSVVAVAVWEEMDRDWLVFWSVWVEFVVKWAG